LKKDSLSFFGKKWEFRANENPTGTLAEAFATAREIPAENWRKFCAPQIADLVEPEQFFEMSAAVEKILSAIRAGKKIAVFGDFDLDGISATAILFETLKILGGKVTAILPARADGFGLSEKFVHRAIAEKIELFITADCGVSNLKEIEKLNAAGVETIVSDHHSRGENLPAATILHPARAAREFEFLTGAGVALKLAQALLEKVFGAKFDREKKFATKILPPEFKNVREFFEHLLALAALGTVADLGKLVGENRTIVSLGISNLRNSKNAGIAALLQAAEIAPEEVNSEKIAFFLAPRLNAAGRLAHPVESLKLLLGEVSRAKILNDLNRQRQEITAESLEEILKKINLNRAALVYRGDKFHPGIIGLLSGQLCEKFGKPAIVACRVGEILVGSCRSGEDFHLADNLKKLEKFLRKSGGHAQAAGFSIESKNFTAFEREFQKLVGKIRGKNPPPPTLKVDAEISVKNLNFPAAEKLSFFGPFGEGFPAPIFVLKNPEVANLRRVGKNFDHLSLTVAGQNAIAFRAVEMDKFLLNSKDFSLAVSPEISFFNSNPRLQLKIIDARRD
jgi:single-stranded-DNA-specific exonuclease